MISYSNIKKTALAALCAAAMGLLAAACSQGKTVTIVSTNDIHGAIENIPRLATMVERLRAEDPELLLLDAGDRWTGNPYVDMVEEKGRPVIELLNRLGYDAVTFGNHEYDFGEQVLADRMADASFPMICANMTCIESPIAQPEALIVREVKGLKIALAGLVTNFSKGCPDGKAENFIGLSFPDPIPALQTVAPRAAQCDAFVVISHLGDDYDPVLAKGVPEIDLIIGGHTHAAISPQRTEGKTVITQTGRKLANVGVTRMHFRGRKLTSIENSLIALDTVTPSPEYTALVERYFDDPGLHRLIGKNPKALNKIGIGEFMAEALRRKAGTDFAFYHYGGVRRDTLPQGDIQMADIYSIEPFGTAYCTMRMSEEEIRQMVTNKFNSSVNPKESHRPDLHPAGMSYTIYTNEAGDAESVVLRHDKRPDKDGYYTVAIPDYTWKVYDFAKERDARSYNTMIADILKESIALTGTIESDNTPKIIIRPASDKGPAEHH